MPRFDTIEEMKLKYCKKVLARFAAASTFVLFAASQCCAGEKVPVPEDAGLYLGAGVYSPIGGMLCGGFCFTYWEPGTLDPTGAVELCAKEGFCNTLPFWQRGEKLQPFGRFVGSGIRPSMGFKRGVSSLIFGMAPKRPTV